MNNINLIKDNADTFPQPQPIIQKQQNYNSSIIAGMSIAAGLLLLIVWRVVDWSSSARYSVDTFESIIASIVFYGLIILVLCSFVIGIIIAARYFYNKAKIAGLVNIADGARVSADAIEQSSSYDARVALNSEFAVRQEYAKQSTYRGLYGSYAPSMSNTSNTSNSNATKDNPAQDLSRAILPDELELDTIGILNMVNKNESI